MSFSVLLSVYIKEKSDYFDKALESILINQTLIPDEVVIVKDGPLTENLENIIDKYLIMFPSLIKVIPLETNHGLGEALNIGLENCSHDLVARADTDDINHPKRFEKQIELFSQRSDLALIGTNIAEFYDSHKHTQTVKVLPEKSKDIFNWAKKRNPVNHMTVMFRKEAVEAAGGYKHLFYLEDYYLWVRMLSKDFLFYNLQEPLVYVRTGDEQFLRRSNRKYIKGWYVLQKEMRSKEMINFFELIISMISITVFIFIPVRLKKYIYQFFLRKKQ
ncbi:glycosyltransferase [Exiguobacterium sp. s26]|uniref:glycosyltransferase n=1 Tax=Exiguobacterium sp. s26 TaxID=2751231 RepID=UPI001BEC6166|nr:glycosyltransferase [Exiguobacterium sp. s26]